MIGEELKIRLLRPILYSPGCKAKARRKEVNKLEREHQGVWVLKASCEEGDAQDSSQGRDVTCLALLDKC